MKKAERMAVGVSLGAVPIITGLLAGWWSSIPLVPERNVWQGAVAGLLAGALVNLRYLARWIRRAYSMSWWLWMAIYGFYSVGMLGFFMGVPVFNVALAVPAGVLVGRKLAFDGSDAAGARSSAKKAAAFTAGVLFVVCLASATVALNSPSTGADLQGMLSLPFVVTQDMIIALVVCGGLLLLGTDWWVTVKATERAYEFFHDSRRGHV